MKASFSFRAVFPASVVLLAASVSPLSAAILVSDVFADGISTNQEIATHSLQVFDGRSTTNTRTDAVGSVTFGITNTGADAFWAHFTDEAPVTLANAGDTLTVRVTFALTIVTTASSDIRFGIGDSKTTRNTADLTAGMNNAVFADDTFYGGIFAVTGTGSPFRISKRIAAPTSPNNPFNNASDALTLTTNAGGSGKRQPLASDTDYTFTYTIRRDSPTQMTMTSALTGGSIVAPYNWTASDDGLQKTAPGLNTSFDWVALRITGSGFASSVVFKKIEVETGSGGGDPYDTWVSGFGLDPAGNGARTIDADGDGLPNAVENLLGLAPNAPDLPASGVVNGTVTSNAFEVRFTRSTAAVVPWKVEWSIGAAAPWAPAVHGQDGVTIVTNPLPNNKEEVIVSLPQNGAARIFARVNAS